MTDQKQDDLDDVMCPCSGTTRGKIIALVTEGITDPDLISRKTGAMSGCGGCQWDIEELIESLS